MAATRFPSRYVVQSVALLLPFFGKAHVVLIKFFDLFELYDELICAAELSLNPELGQTLNYQQEHQDVEWVHTHRVSLIRYVTVDTCPEEEEKHVLTSALGERTRALRGIILVQVREERNVDAKKPNDKENHHADPGAVAGPKGHFVNIFLECSHLFEDFFVSHFQSPVVLLLCLQIFLSLCLA